MGVKESFPEEVILKLISEGWIIISQAKDSVPSCLCPDVTFPLRLTVITLFKIVAYLLRHSWSPFSCFFFFVDQDSNKICCIYCREYTKLFLLALLSVVF